MIPDSPLSKRLKRHVIGRLRTYFAATAPGFETLCFKELSALALSTKNASVIPGGVEFEGRLQDCYLANLHLRTADRILMRIHQLKASSFRQLAKKTAEIPWELYLPPDSAPKVHTTTKHCRLYHTDAIGEILLEGMSKYVVSRPDPGNNQSGLTFEPMIFVRGADDHFTISIDSSGEHLHKRGLKRHPGKAPLRETMAAAALLQAGYMGREPLIDPMCGTGTFSLEAALMAKKIPPGWFREFAFMNWPSFRPKRWEYLKHQCQTNFKSSRSPLIFASDKDPAACRQIEKCMLQHHLSDVIKISNIDFFDFLPRDLTDQTGLIALNPPYGRRIGNRAESEALFLRITAKLTQDYTGWKLVLIAPGRAHAGKVPFRLDVHPLSHGGLKPVLMTGTIS